jgi:hypothetical protein
MEGSKSKTSASSLQEVLSGHVILAVLRAVPDIMCLHDFG